MMIIQGTKRKLIWYWKLEYKGIDDNMLVLKMFLEIIQVKWQIKREVKWLKAILNPCVILYQLTLFIFIFVNVSPSLSKSSLFCPIFKVTWNHIMTCQNKDEFGYILWLTLVCFCHQKNPFKKTIIYYYF
jgi:hypothetical protein